MNISCLCFESLSLEAFVAAPGLWLGSSQHNWVGVEQLDQVDFGRKVVGKSRD
jgi:hypothetical protein